MQDRDADPDESAGLDAPAGAASNGFPCAQCGGDLAFDPEAGALACRYCGHRQPPPDIDPFTRAEALRELDYAAALADAIDASETETTIVVPCDSCGAEVAFDGPQTARACPFCAAPLVAESRAHRHFKPKAAAPFLISEKRARDALRRWLGSRWFAPGDLVERVRAGRPLSGVYLPYWTFDADTRSDYDGQRGDVHYVTRWVSVRRKGVSRRVKRRVPQVRWSARSGRVARRFDDVLVLASKSLPPSLTRKLNAEGAFDLDGLLPYAPEYLAGFGAESYRVDLEEGYAGAKGVMAYTIRRDVRLDIGGDRQRIHRIDTQYADVTFKHVLLPVWIAAYRYRGKVFRYLVNGRTGVVMGERPWSWWKIAFAGAAALIFGAALLWLAVEIDG